MTMYLSDDLTVTELLDSAAESRLSTLPVRTVPAQHLLHTDILVSAMGDTFEAPIDHINRVEGWVWVKPRGHKWLRLTEYEDVTVRNPTLR